MGVLLFEDFFRAVSKDILRHSGVCVWVASRFRIISKLLRIWIPSLRHSMQHDCCPWTGTNMPIARRGNWDCFHFHIRKQLNTLGFFKGHWMGLDLGLKCAIAPSGKAWLLGTILFWVENAPTNLSLYLTCLLTRGQLWWGEKDGVQHALELRECER